jgi:RNA polymerase sigma-70 factor (ECF subfamily)
MGKSEKIEHDLLDLQNNMRNFAYSLTLDKDQAEDLCQDTTLKVLDNQDKFSENVNFKGWVFTIMKNIFINNYRKAVRNQIFTDKTDDLYLLNLPQNSGFSCPESSYAFREISNTTNLLPDEWRIPFSMHIQGYKYEEISSMLEMPVGTVKSRIFLARKRLQEELKDYIS